MPALITHYQFANDVYDELYNYIGGSRDEADAFFLGNQGPDPLFYGLANPAYSASHRLAQRMHREKPDKLLAAFKAAVRKLRENDRQIGRAYVLGFVCHYLLDSTMHPFVYAQEYALCDAGEPGLTRDNASDVHALIETELDELVLSTRRNETIATFNPSKVVLKASDRVLDVISKLYVNVASDVFDQQIPPNTYKVALKLFRKVAAVFHSPDGLKRNVLGRLEMLIRPYSFVRAMSHHNRLIYESDFDNRNHEVWINPWDESPCTLSFFELYDKALSRALCEIVTFDENDFETDKCESITQTLNFRGESVVASIISVEEAPAPDQLPAEEVYEVDA